MRVLGTALADAPADAAVQESVRRRHRMLDDFLRAVGPRYARCRLRNFDASTPEQRAVLAALTAYRDELPQRVENGQGIVLFGPSGTGKDHLLTAIAGAAIERHGLRVAFRHGLDLFDAFRGTIDGAQTASALLAELTAPEILYLSDPLRLAGPLTPFEQDWLLRVLDRRYRHCRPTWLSVNVQCGAELGERIGPQSADRLRHGALALFCGWASYRTPLSGPPRKNDRTESRLPHDRGAS